MTQTWDIDLHRYWDTLLSIMWPRFEHIVEMNIQSVRACDPQKMGQIDVRPHYVSLHVPCKLGQNWPIAIGQRAWLTNRGPIWYLRAWLTNRGPIWYLGAWLTNRGPIWYLGAWLANRGPIWYLGAWLMNRGPIWYLGAFIHHLKVMLHR